MADRRGRHLGPRLPRSLSARDHDDRRRRSRAEIAFGAGQAGLDIEYSRSSVGFAWEGFDEIDVTGAGSAKLLDDGSIEVEFAYHNGDEAVPKAKREISSTACRLDSGGMWSGPSPGKESRPADMMSSRSRFTFRRHLRKSRRRREPFCHPLRINDGIQS